MAKIMARTTTRAVVLVGRRLERRAVESAQLGQLLGQTDQAFIGWNHNRHVCRLRLAPHDPNPQVLAADLTDPFQLLLALPVELRQPVAGRQQVRQ